VTNQLEDKEMRFRISNRALLRGMIASAVVLAGATACSRSDRSDTGRDNTAAVLPDTTAADTATPSATGTTPAGTATDTGTVTGAISDTAAARAPRARTTPAGEKRDSVSTSNDASAGYREMGRDTAASPADTQDSARATGDTSETSLNTTDTASVETANAAVVSDTTPTSVAIGDSAAEADADTTATDVAAAADTAVAGYGEMARDTSTGTPEQADSALQAEGDVAQADTAAIQARVDTTAEVPTEVAVGPRAKEDTMSIKADSLAQYHKAERVRPPEDSTEILGNVTGSEEADTSTVNQEDQETIAASEARTDEVGAAAIGGNVTGAEAVSLMTRQGAECIVVDPESNEAVRWDMSSTPATLNPCGMGSMNLSRIWTAGSR